MSKAPYVRPTRAVINLSALRSNFRALTSALSKDTKILSIVKANGYGHGSFTIAHECAKLGAVGAGVADVSEALTLRESGYRKPILCLGAVYKEALPLAIQENLIVTLHAVEQLKTFLKFAAGSRKALRLHLKIETGMHRLGLNEEDWGWVAQKLMRAKNLKIEGIFTHLAESDHTNPSFTNQQIHNFHSSVDLFQNRLQKRLIRHAANSGGILNHPRSHFDWVRPGISLYGYPYPSPRRPSPRFVPILTWKAPIVQVKSIAPGESVGYNRAFKAKKSMTLATVATGYGDGYLRRYVDVGVGFRKKRTNVLGIICMDLLMIDVSSFSNVQVGEEVTLVGPSATGAPDAYELAQSQKTIPYEILTNVLGRVTRDVQ